MALQKYLKIKSSPNTTVNLNIITVIYSKTKDNIIQHYALRVRHIAEELGTTFSNIQERTVASNPPWNNQTTRCLSRTKKIDAHELDLSAITRVNQTNS